MSEQNTPTLSEQVSSQNVPSRVYEEGLYVNVYKGNWGKPVTSDPFLSPSEAEKHIIWDDKYLKYQFTALMTKATWKVKHP